MEEKEYTLVLDLDETLIHFVDMGSESYFLIRPGAIMFLEEMYKYYELVVFTAGMKDYADWVLDQLDTS
jgi:CTD small phosphatase-like protein 2